VPTRSGEPTARELAASLAAKEMSARELAESYLARIARVNGALNAAVHVDHQGLALGTAVPALEHRCHGVRNVEEQHARFRERRTPTSRTSRPMASG